MMLTLRALLDYLRNKQLATVDVIATAFHVDESLVVHMLDRLVKNGCVVCMKTSACSSGCGSCVLRCREVYRLS